MPVAVLYVTGWCRSGSTVLGNVLAEVPGVFHAGELRFLWLNGVLGAGSNRRCGCGAELLDCPLWSRVLEAGRPASRTLAGYAADVVRWQAACRTRHTRRVLRQAPHNGWPDILTATYHAIAAHTGARLIVDSSKYASDAALLTHLDGIEPAYVHLVRDPRGVAMSWLQPKDYTGRRGVLNSTAYWVGFNLAAEAVSAARPQAALRLRYEDLTRDPRGSVTRVLALVGRGAEENPVAADGHAELGPNHTVTGNPNRFERGSVWMREDRRWHNGLPASQRATATVVALPLIGRYNYSRKR
jgi:Sulfotransferase family